MKLKITKPTLIVDEAMCRANIREMALKARNSQVDFRPHFKTHQSAEIGEWFSDEGVDKITVSSVAMAKYFAEYGWNDITIAFPYNFLEASEINELAKRVQLNILIESAESLNHLNSKVDAPIGYYVKIDVGTGRTGVPKSNFQILKALTNSKNQNHHFAGFLAHAGHSYQEINISKAQTIFNSSLDILNLAKSTVGGNPRISYGDTPTCSLVTDFEGIDEIRPGNFVFYDAQQYEFGACKLDRIAVCLVCPIVSLHPERNEAVFYGGAVHLSKDKTLNPESPFGLVASLNDNGLLPEVVASVVRLSQEHGILQGSKEYISQLKVGDLIGVLPAHSCLTANLQRSYLSLDGHTISKFN